MEPENRDPLVDYTMHLNTVFQFKTIQILRTYLFSGTRLRNPEKLISNLRRLDESVTNNGVYYRSYDLLTSVTLKS